ncbi:MAG: Flp pilus assembly protein CpaB [Oscillospiraceae bacterium]|nr:Flp pilus assembly protein CpaB [Oscillospiraceae bacterium]
MKNRTVIGVICMVLAIAITFLVAPLVNQLSTDTSEVIRLVEDVKQGVEINADHLEVARVKTDSIPTGTLNDPKDIIGKYTASQLYAGDYLTAAKLTGEANTASDVFASLDGTKVAVSVTIDTFAAGLSGKLENGDVISMIVVEKETGKAYIPAALKYMKVITTTTSGGIDQDSIVKNEDGSYEIPSTVTLLANTEQAKLLAKYNAETTLTVALVYRGSTEKAQKFLDVQDEFFANGWSAENENSETQNSGAPAQNGGSDSVQQANDIINGNKDYYDVEEAVNGNG